jgi:hypothetical protein
VFEGSPEIEMLVGMENVMVECNLVDLEVNGRTFSEEHNIYKV